jgi:hypothetical protein
LTEKGKKLMEALQDAEIQKLAWRRYGLRSGAIGIGIEQSLLGELRLPEQIQAATPLPAIEVMEMILNALN